MRYLIAVALYLSVFFVQAQKKELTLSDAVLKRGSTFNPATIKGLKWMPDGKHYCFVENDTLWKQSIAPEGKKMRVSSLADLNKGLNGTKTLKRFPMIFWNSETEFYFRHGLSIYNTDITTMSCGVMVSAVKGSANQFYHPQSKQMAYTFEDNVYVTTNDGIHIQVTKDGGDGITSGSAVHRHEFGISKGLFWAPSGKKIAYYRNDQSMVTEYPIVHINTKPASLENIRYPMAGDKSEEVTLHVYDIAMDKDVTIKTGEPKEQYLTNIVWGPGEEFIYIAVLNRDQNHLKLNAYNASTGAFVKTLFEEKDKKYVQPLHGMYFLNDKEFVWMSQREGYWQLYHYGLNGKVKRKLTTGSWVVKSILGLSADKKVLYFTGTGEDPKETNAFSVVIKTGKVTRLTKEAGVHRVQLSADGAQLIDNYSNTKVPRSIGIINTATGARRNLLTAANPMDDYQMGELNLFKITNGKAKVDLHCRMIKPHNFDQNKKYPVLVYLYNGPMAQMITNSYLGGAPLWMYHMANRGYIIFTLDGRGSNHRGIEFEQAIFRDVGTVEMEDQLMGAMYLKSLQFVDTNRMAVHGWSYGGFMTTSLMLKHPGAFKVGVAGGPVIDWKYYEVMYTERYMDTPQTNPEGYKNTSLLDKVGNLKGNLLVIHGAVDDVVVWQHSLDFVKKCVDEGVQLDYFMYPEHPHNVRGKDRVHLMQKVLDYVDDKLN